MNYSQQLVVVEGLSIPSNTETRMDCPFCLGRNTFSVKTIDGTLSWYCFRASCEAKGKKRKEKNMNDVNAVFNKSNLKKIFYVPDSFKSIYSNAKAVEYLKQNNVIKSMLEGKAEVQYDVRQERIVFLIKNNDKVVGAVGRALSSEIYPKWFMYGDKEIPFVIKGGSSRYNKLHGNNLIIVEDCASACAVSFLLSSMALLGTDFADEYIKYIKDYDKVIIALDRDATTKSFEIVSRLRFNGVDTKVLILENDLKYLNEEEIVHKIYGK